MRYINSSLWILKLMSHFSPGWVFPWLLKLMSGCTWNKRELLNELNFEGTIDILLGCMHLSPRGVFVSNSPHVTEPWELSRILQMTWHKASLYEVVITFEVRGWKLSFWLILRVVLLSCVLSNKKLFYSNSIMPGTRCIDISLHICDSETHEESGSNGSLALHISLLLFCWL